MPDHDVARQASVQRSAESEWIQAGVGAEAGHLPQRVHAGIGAPRSRHWDGGTNDPDQRLLQEALDRQEAGLDLPAMIGRALIFQNQLEPTHRKLSGDAPVGEAFFLARHIFTGWRIFTVRVKYAIRCNSVNGRGNVARFSLDTRTASVAALPYWLAAPGIAPRPSFGTIFARSCEYLELRRQPGN